MVQRSYCPNSDGVRPSEVVRRPACVLTDPIAQQIDAIGLLCPLPILRFKKRTQDLESGAVVELLADDPTGLNDLQALCDIAGHSLLAVDLLDNGVTCYRVKLSSR